MPDQTEAGIATAFFDQFPPLHYSGAWPAESRWCPRHWAPAVLLRCNGLGAATELMMIFTREIAPPNVRSPAMLNRELAKAGYLCCKLGDERMYELWGHWPPCAAADDVASATAPEDGNRT